MNTPSTETIIQILKDVAPDECADVGDYYVQLLAEDKTEFVKPEGSTNVDLTAVLGGLAAIVSIAKSGLEIYVLLKDKLGRKPTVDELSKDLKQKILSKPHEAKEDIHKLIPKVAKSISNAK